MLSWLSFESQTNSPRDRIRVEFSIADLNAANSAEDLDDSALFDDQTSDDGITSGGAQSKAGKSEGRSPAGNTPADEEDDFDDDQPVSFPSRVNVTIEKVSYEIFRVANKFFLCLL